MGLTRLTDAKKTAFEWVEANQGRLSDFHQLIWNYAETAFREYKSSKAFARFLEGEGFQVTLGVAGMPTAFEAVWGEGGPTICTYCEYDAVPSAWQDQVPYRSAANPYRAGHTDPHSALGVGAGGGVRGPGKGLWHPGGEGLRQELVCG